MKDKIQLIAGIISLVGLLAYTLVHTGGLLARYIEPHGVGYVAAMGIEIAIVSLSLRIGDLKRGNLDYRFFLFVLVSVVVVSALANVAEGFATSTGERLTVGNVSRMDIVEVVIGLSATGLISLIVLALSEIIGTDVQAVITAEDKKRRVELKKTEMNVQPAPIEAARELAIEQSRNTRSERIAAILNIYRDDPGAKPSEICRELNIGRTTLYNYQQELIESGTITKNGNGIEVL